MLLANRYGYCSQDNGWKSSVYQMLSPSGNMLDSRLLIAQGPQRTWARIGVALVSSCLVKTSPHPCSFSRRSP